MIFVDFLQCKIVGDGFPVPQMWFAVTFEKVDETFIFAGKIHLDNKAR